MATQEKASGQKATFHAVEELLKAADGDTAFRDLYLQRAAARLAEVMPESEYRSLIREQPRLDLLRRQVQAEVRSQNWQRVNELSGQVDRLQQSLRQKEAALALAGAVYDADDVRVDPFSSGLSGFALAPGETLEGLRKALLTVLRDLAKQDTAWANFYGERHAHFEQKVVPSETVTAEAKPTKSVDLPELRAQAQRAAERGDMASLQRLSEQITRLSAAKSESSPAAAERRADAPASVTGTVSKEPFPQASIERAAKLGLEHVCTKLRFAEVSAVLTEFLARHAWQPGLPAQDVAHEGAVHLREQLRDVDLPDELKGPAVEMAAIFALHPLVNSAGVRYLGIEAGEYVLLETFAEDADSAAGAEMLSLLGLQRRRGVSRIEIEQALRRRGAAILQEQMGLEPREFRLVCVPFDVFGRVGAERGWGTQPLWTHVDGYAVGRGGRLSALAAGHVRYGGLQDLVMVGAAYQNENTIVRFSVVRRTRFLPAGS